MKMKLSRSAAAAAALALALAAAGCGNGADRRTAESPKTADAHGAEEDAVILSTESMRLAGIGVSEIGLESIGLAVEMPGEIGYNEERRIHITPRYAGVIREVRARLGDSVRQGYVFAVIESNASLTPYEIVAQIAGRVVEMHAALGEFVGEDRDLFVVADLCVGMGELRRVREECARVRIGQRMTIAAVGSEDTVRGTVDYISPALNEKTRAAVVRAILPGSSVWRPGLFIRGTLASRGANRSPPWRRDAVQLLGETQVIFIGGTAGRIEACARQNGTRRRDDDRARRGAAPGDEVRLGGRVRAQGSDRHEGIRQPRGTRSLREEPANEIIF